MNINEVEKHVKFDLIFTLIVIFMVGLCFLLSIVFIFKPDSVKAKEVSNTISISAKSYMPCGSTSVNGKYCAASSQNSFNVRNVGTTYNGTLIGLTFQFGDMINAHSQYVMTIEAMSTDFRNNDFDVLVYASSQSDQQGSMIFNYTYSFVSKSKIQIIFTPDSYNYHTVILSGNPLTGISTYGIRKVTLSYDDGINDNSDIINSNTQNTSDIIDNANSNTNDIINASAQNALDIINNQNDNQNKISTDFYKIQSFLANMCPNLFGNYQIFPTTQINSDGIYVTDQNSEVWSVPVNAGDTYTLQANTNRQWVYNFSIIGRACLNCQGTARVVTGARSVTFTVPNGMYYLMLRNYPTNNENNLTQQVMLSKGTTVKTYCAFGSNSGSKLDVIENAVHSGLSDVNISVQEGVDLQQQQNDYLMDDTNPTVNTSDMNNVIGQVNIQDPLNYLLTLPINLLTRLNTVITSGTCSKASFGELYGTELYLPCINFENYLGSSLWGTIDTIVGIGLLAIILKKFYDSISNILSLGKEEEVRKGMELPTPMEFLAQILGGGK